MSKHLNVGQDLNEKNILVSIILSESTCSLLNWDVRNVEDHSHISSNRCTIPPVNSGQLPNKNSIFANWFRTRKSSNLNSDLSNEIFLETAFFSQSFQSDSESYSDMSTSSELDMDTEIGQNLIPQEIYIRPLLNGKVVPHQDKILVKNNHIIIDLLDSDSSSSSEFICRICHGGQSSGDLLKPCKCKGSIALAHIECLERWLKESENSYCELCQYHFKVIREPKYNFFWSILIYLSEPGDNFRDILIDLVAFTCYTPSALATTYMLMLICENVAKGHLAKSRTFSSQLLAFCAIFGMAAIDFTYSSWLILTYQRHALAWRTWYKNNGSLRVLLAERRKRSYGRSKRLGGIGLKSDSLVLSQGQ